MDTSSSRSPCQRAIDYRQQAAQFRQMAGTALHTTLAEQLLRLADEYDRLAESESPAIIVPQGAIVSQGARSPAEQELYRSSNGDCWYLVREPESERMLIRHQPNQASGGRSSLICVEDFLAEDYGPQQEALLRVIGGNQEQPRGSDRID